LGVWGWVFACSRCRASQKVVDRDTTGSIQTDRGRCRDLLDTTTHSCVQSKKPNSVCSKNYVDKWAIVR
jgi:hypothetical protein